MWGLLATIAGEIVQFNWDYPQQGQDFGGAQQYLVRADGSYVRLDDPNPARAGDPRERGAGPGPFLLQFDGNWMQGLPNVFDELRKAGFEVDDAIKAKAFSIPNGTVIGPYVVKQLQVSQDMARSLAGSARPRRGLRHRFLDGADVRGPRHGRHSLPAPLKYSEGNPVTPYSASASPRPSRAPGLLPEEDGPGAGP